MIEYLPTVFMGFVVSGGLIVAIGSQNAFLIRCGLRNTYPLHVATLCFLSDALLISIGTFGAGNLFAQYPTAKTVMVVLGILFLVVYGIMALRSAWKGQSTLTIEAPSAEQHTLTHTLGKVLLITLAMTYLNPHVYIDTVILIGGITTSLTLPMKQAFVVGAIMASAVWFYSIALLSRQLAPKLNNTKTWRIIDSVIAFIMFAVAANLAVSLR